MTDMCRLSQCIDSVDWVTGRASSLWRHTHRQLPKVCKHCWGADINWS